MIEVDAAIGSIWEYVGELIKRAGKEDCSGLRRCLVRHLVNRNHKRFDRQVRISHEDFDALRERCVAEWREP